MKYLPLILVSILLVSGCVTYTDQTQNNQTVQKECQIYSDCKNYNSSYPYSSLRCHSGQCIYLYEGDVLGECLEDFDCVPTGCSSQVCAPKGSDLVTTCEWRPEYECLQLTSCGCVENRCAWEENPEYQSCLESPPNKDMGPIF